MSEPDRPDNTPSRRNLDFGPDVEIDPRTRLTTRRLLRMRGVLESRQPDFRVVLENVHDPHNVSAVLRTCDAVGIDTVHLLYTVEKFPSIGRNSSAGVGKWLTLERHGSVEECFAALRDVGCRVFATSLEGNAVSLYDIDFTGPIALVFGNEHRGVSTEVVERADGTVRIPMFGFVESLNISVACAVSLYEGVRQRLERGLYDSPALAPEELEARLGEWTKR